MKSAYSTIHPGKNHPPPQNGCRLKSVIFLKHQFHILHLPDSTGLSTKPTGRHYTNKYRFSPDIVIHALLVIMIIHLQPVTFIHTLQPHSSRYSSIRPSSIHVVLGSRGDSLPFLLRPPNLPNCEQDAKIDTHIVITKISVSMVSATQKKIQSR